MVRGSLPLSRIDSMTDSSYAENRVHRNNDGTDTSDRKDACTLNRPTNLVDDGTRSKLYNWGVRNDWALTLNRYTTSSVSVTKPGMELPGGPKNAITDNTWTKDIPCLVTVTELADGVETENA